MIGPQLTHKAPASGLLKYWLARTFLRLTGWDVIGQVPPATNFVLIGAHHTSNWDFVLGLCATYVFRLKVSWMGKDSLFRWPFGYVMRALGGIAVDRSSPHGVVSQIVQQLKHSNGLAVMIAPEGTRKKKENWKSGFYWIARQAQVPIVCGYLDYERKQACIGLSILPSDNVEQDMDRIREFYQDVIPRKSEKVSPVRLRDEGVDLHRVDNAPS